MEFMIKLRCSPRAAIGRLSHQSTVGRELVNGCMRWIYAEYYMPSTKIYIIGFLQVKAEMALGKLVQKDTGNLATDMDGNLRTVR